MKIEINLMNSDHHRFIDMDKERKALTSLALRGSHTSEISLLQLQEFSDANAS